MEYDFKYEHFNSIYDFEKALQKPVNEFFIGREESHQKDFDFTKTESYEEADGFLKNGWNAEIENIEHELKKFSNTITVKRSRQIKSVAGYAPCVPNAIRGVPKSMIATELVNRIEKRRFVHIIFNNTATGFTESDVLMKSGLTVLKLALVLDRMNVRTKIDISPKMSIKGNSCYGCTVSIKDYRQPFNISKIAYPLAHVSFFRRHGFRYFETLEGFSNSEMARAYGSSVVMHKDEQIVKDYFKFAGFVKDDTVYIDFEDVCHAYFDYKKLAELKGISLA